MSPDTSYVVAQTDTIALGYDRAAVMLRKPFRQAESDAQTAFRTMKRATVLREHIEDPIDRLGSNPHSAVADA